MFQFILVEFGFSGSGNAVFIYRMFLGMENINLLFETSHIKQNTIVMFI